MARNATETFGNRVRLARFEAGLSRAKLARELQVNERTVAYWEDEDRIPRPEYLPRLADLTGKSVAWLLNGEAAA